MAQPISGAGRNPCPCFPVFAFCLPRSCCRCRSWSSGLARRPGYVPRMSNSPACRPRFTPAESVFAGQNDAPEPTLALLRFDPPTPEKVPDDVPAAAAPETVTPAAEAPDAAPAEPDQTAALSPAEPAPAGRRGRTPGRADARTPAPRRRSSGGTGATPAEAVGPDAKEVAPVADEKAKVAATAAPPEPPPAIAPVAPQPPATDTVAGRQRRRDEDRHAGRAPRHHR